MLNEYASSTYVVLSGAVAAAYYFFRIMRPSIKFQAHSRRVNNLRVTDMGLIVTITRRTRGASPAIKEYALYFTSKG